MAKIKIEELASLLKMSLEDTKKLLDSQDEICLDLKSNKEDD